MAGCDVTSHRGGGKARADGRVALLEVLSSLGLCARSRGGTKALAESTTLRLTAACAGRASQAGGNA